MVDLLYVFMCSPQDDRLTIIMKRIIIAANVVVTTGATKYHQQNELDEAWKREREAPVN